jgi:hypothetical protein
MAHVGPERLNEVFQDLCKMTKLGFKTGPIVLKWCTHDKVIGKSEAI